MVNFVKCSYIGQRAKVSVISNLWFNNMVTVARTVSWGDGCGRQTVVGEELRGGEGIMTRNKISFFFFFFLEVS